MRSRYLGVVLVQIEKDVLKLVKDPVGTVVRTQVADLRISDLVILTFAYSAIVFLHLVRQRTNSPTFIGRKIAGKIGDQSDDIVLNQRFGVGDFSKWNFRHSL